MVYEGRSSGPSASCLSAGGDGSDFAHDDAGRGVTGAHVGGMNSGNVGVALLGEYSKAVPPAAQRSALEEQLAILATRHGIDPEQLDFGYVNPVTGNTKTIPTVSGHRDWLATECPGGELYAQLPSIRSKVKDRMASSTTTTTTSSTTTTTSSTTTTRSSTTTTSTTTTTPAPIELRATAYKVKGVQHVDLAWSGATTATVHVWRDGAVVARGTANDGAHTDRIRRGGGSYTYRVCEAASATCSSNVRVAF